MLSENLKILRKDKNITQKELANFLKVTQSAVGMWESAQRTPDIMTIKKIADYFQVNIDDLLNADYKSSSNENQKHQRLFKSLLREINKMNESDLENLLNYAKFTRSLSEKKL